MSKVESATKSSQGFEQAILKLLDWYFRLCSCALKTRFYRDLGFFVTGTLWAMISHLLIEDYKFLILLFDWISPAGIVTKLLISIPEWVYYTFSALVFLNLNLLWGLVMLLRVKNAQVAIEKAGVSKGQGRTPKVLGVWRSGDRDRILIDCNGVSIKYFEAAKEDIRTAFGKYVEDVQSARNLKHAMLYLSSSTVPVKVDYSELCANRTFKPFEFLVGHSASGTVVQDICKLPHMLVAGTTGGGKSMFLRNVFVGLLEASDRIKIYILDLKQGVEAKAFEGLANVKRATSMSEALQVLEYLNREMTERLKFLEQNSLRSVDPKRDKLDIIVCCIDEASELFLLKGVTDPIEKQNIEKARRLTDNLSKLARAAGIHLILTTQKVTKDTIDTRTQENISAQMCFKMSSIQGSTTVLGNSSACDLPTTKGRGIWRYGNEQIEVQTPFLSDEELSGRLDRLREKFSDYKESALKTLSESQISSKESQANLKKAIDTGDNAQPS